MTLLTAETGSRAGAPPWKCPHEVYSPTGRAEYCLSCTPEGPPDEDDSEAATFAFWTCARCWKTKPIEQFPTDPRTGAPYPNCAACSSPRVPNPNREDRTKQYSLRRRRHGIGNFTMAAWIEKLSQAGWLCTFCECPLTTEAAVCARWIPGGPNDIENCTPACARCQRMRAASFRWHRLAA